MTTLTNQLTALKIKLIEERRQRMAIEESEEYLDFQEKIQISQEYLDDLKEDQKKLFSEVPDSTEEYEEVKRELMAEFRAKGLEKLDNIKASWRVSKAVNTKRLMDFFQGDLDPFFTLAKVTQKDLKDFEKDNEVYKGVSKECIEETARELTDLTVELE